MPQDHSSEQRHSRPVLRFAPSPNGLLHLGHAYSALVNRACADELDGRLLLRIEDIDTERCRPQFETALKQDLAWLGFRWEEPARRQSEHFGEYGEALQRLIDEELAYPAFMSRGDVRAYVSEHEDDRPWPRDPDGALRYPGLDRKLNKRERERRIDGGATFAWRIDMDEALRRLEPGFTWTELGAGPEGEQGAVMADPSSWGDFVIARREVPTSYQLAVVVDDALQSVTHVVRGRDLFHATAAQRLLQELLRLPVPIYLHHDLVLGDDGRKLSKSRGDTALQALREAGLRPDDIRRMIGL